MGQWQIFQIDGVYDSLLPGLRGDQARAVIRHVNLLKIYGDQLGPPISKQIKGFWNLFELRPKKIRIFYCLLPGRKAVLLLSAFKDQKKLRPEVYQAAANRKALIEKLGELSWKQLSRLN